MAKRCLHCERELSFLKGIKGKSFCSPEHDDLYLLEQSRQAIARLNESEVKDENFKALSHDTEAAEVGSRQPTQP